MQDYALGATKDGSVIYWQIDTKGKVRTGKVMKYDPNSGHRIKNGGGINWIQFNNEETAAIARGL